MIPTAIPGIRAIAPTPSPSGKGHFPNPPRTLVVRLAAVDLVSTWRSANMNPTPKSEFVSMLVLMRQEPVSQSDIGRDQARTDA